jgi:predicted dehydrogenase
MAMMRITNTFLFIVIFIVSASEVSSQTPVKKPLRIAIAGTSHGHSAWILGRKDTTDVIVTGIYEPDPELTRKHIKQYGLPKELFYNNLEKMLDQVKPEAAVAFGSIKEHLAVVEACAPRGIHVMVEKPLATTVQDAERMRVLSEKNKIFLLTNYETSWYPTTEKTHELAIDSNYAGKIRKVVFHHGHEGPKEIGVSREFFSWLTDPVQNGGGALVDFGCYGANIMTWMMNGSAPVAVTAVTRQFKPEIYPKVDDDATIIVEYPGAQCIIQASWNWPFGRKDMELYGETGYIIAQDKNTLRRKNKAGINEQVEQVTATEVAVYEDPFKYFADVVNKKIEVPENSLYSLSNNVMVVRILEAAKRSAATGKRVRLE